MQDLVYRFIGFIVLVSCIPTIDPTARQSEQEYRLPIQSVINDKADGEQKHFSITLLYIGTEERLA